MSKTERFVAGLGSRLRQRANKILSDDERPINMVAVDRYLVPSQSGGGHYRVVLVDPFQREGWHASGYTNDWCQCPQHASGEDDDGRRVVCKHILAVRLLIRTSWVDEDGDGRRSVEDPRPRKPPPKGYEAAKKRERRCVRELVRCLAPRVFGNAVLLPNPEPTEGDGGATHAA